jgi:hypothetical protein
MKKNVVRYKMSLCVKRYFGCKATRFRIIPDRHDPELKQN